MSLPDLARTIREAAEIDAGMLAGQPAAETFALGAELGALAASMVSAYRHSGTLTVRVSAANAARAVHVARAFGASVARAVPTGDVWAEPYRLEVAFGQ